jgi:DNA-binding response OmpR family regulator
MTRILVVEDDPDVLLLFQEVLVDAGYQVDTAATCEEASQLLELRGYDLLLSDGRLPDGTGILLADTAKAKRIPALIVTGYVGWLHERYPKLDINAYNVLRKPVTPQMLLGAITNTIGGDYRSPKPAAQW